MIGSLFRLGLLATLVGGSTFALVGPDRLKMYFESGKDTVMNAIEDAQGLESKLSLIRSQIRGLDEEIADLKEEAIRRKVEVEALESDVAAREAELEKKARVLEKVKDMLADGSAHYTIGHTRYTRAAIEQDAQEKLALFNVQAETLNSLRETLETKKNALRIAEENVGRARSLRAEMQSKVGLLEARLQQFRAKQHFAATAKGELIDTDELDSDLAKAREMIENFERDLEVKARLLEEHLRMGAEQPTDGIDYEALERGEDAEDLVSRIDRVLLEVCGPQGVTSCSVAVAPTVIR